MKNKIIKISGILLSVTGLVGMICLMISRDKAGPDTITKRKMDISEINSIVVDEKGALYCLGDKGKVLVFSNNGDYEYTIIIPEAGKGEAQMDMIENALCIRDQDETVYQYKSGKLICRVHYDDKNKKVLVYNSNESLVKEIDTPKKKDRIYELIAYTPKGLVIEEYSSKEFDEGSFVVVDKSGQQYYLDEDSEFYEEYEKAEDINGNIFKISGSSKYYIEKYSLDNKKEIIYKIPLKLRVYPFASVMMLACGILMLLYSRKAKQNYSFV